MKKTVARFVSFALVLLLLLGPLTIRVHADNGSAVPDAKSQFTDVPEGKYYSEPVSWAVSQNPVITTGTDPKHFSPHESCTRGQVLTFLWRAAGSPEPKAAENPYRDVKEDKYYYKAVLWAIETGITYQTTAAKRLYPNDPCTRIMAITWLYRACGSPDPGSGSGFNDVEADGEETFYYIPALWARNNSVTKGIDGENFGVDLFCTRAQMITFLYRAFAQK